MTHFFLIIYSLCINIILQNRKTRVILRAFNAAASSCRRANFLQLCFKVYSVANLYLEIP